MLIVIIATAAIAASVVSRPRGRRGSLAAEGVLALVLPARASTFKTSATRPAARIARPTPIVVLDRRA